MTRPADEPWPHSYEQMRAEIANLKSPDAPGGRTVYWVDGQRNLGVARDEAGHLELFIPGDAPLAPVSEIVAAQLSHGPWSRCDGGHLLATRLLLPSATYYDAVAAFLCAELRTNGVDDDAGRAFRLSEPLIEMVLTQLALRSEALTGLLGELLALTALVDCCSDDRLRDLLQGWRGHLHSARDLQLNDVGLEVKTTRSTRSTHPVQGVWQVERGHVAAGHAESIFYLLSIGVERAEVGGAGKVWSVAGLVDELLGEIRSRLVDDADDLAEGLIERLRSYGDDGGEGYEHETMKDLVAYREPWRTTFVRLYDMVDEDVLALRTVDLVPFTMVDPATVRYDLRLPDKVHGDLNPTRGLSHAAAVVVTKAWGPGARRELHGDGH